MEFLTPPIAEALGFWDIAIVLAAVSMLFVIAYFTGRKETDTRDFFLGNRRVPTAVACLSFVATEVSALTIIGVPAVAYSENWQYLQFFVGSAAARVFVAFLFIPVFYKHNCTTIYQFLRDRFGPQTQYGGSFFFFVTRLIASGVRLYAACAAVGMIMGWSLEQALLLFTGVSIVFIAFGGIKAVVWNGAYQAIMFYLGGAALIIYALVHIDGGIASVWQIAGEAGRLSVFKFDFNLNDPTTFWAGTANAFFIGLAVFGTDQELVQRLLTVETRASSQKAILATIGAGLPVLCIYLAVGTLLFVFYQQHPHLPPPAKAKELLAHFVHGVLPVGLKGLILAVIVLASIDSPLSSLSSSFVTDIYRPLINRHASERHYLWVSRAGVVGFGLALGLIALACTRVSNILWFAFEVFSVTGGAVLGTFLLGLLTKRRGSIGNVVAMGLSALAMLTLLLLAKFGPIGLQSALGLTQAAVPAKEPPIVPLAWSWLIVIGTFLTFVLGYFLGPLMEKRKPA